MSAHWGPGDDVLVDAWIVHGVPDSVDRNDMADMIWRLRNRHRALVSSISEYIDAGRSDAPTLFDEVDA